MIVDLPPPTVIWHRWATLAAALTAIGFDDTWTVGEAGAHHDDGGGNWSHLTLIEGGRAVLYGYDHEYSDTVAADPPIDLLAEAPPWLPWEELTDRAARDELGYVLWHDGNQWAKVPYPEGMQDGLRSTAGQVLDDHKAGAELTEFVFEWGEHTVDTPEERDEVAAAATRLLHDYRPERLNDLLGRLPAFDAYAGHTVAARAGLIPGTTAPHTAAGTRPPRRTIRKLSETEHDRLIWAAMQQAEEKKRPTPVPTGELGALITWLRGRAPAADGRCSLLAYADATSVAARQGDHPPAEHPDEGRFGLFRELSTLVRRLREAEADPAHGSWLFLRVETTPEAATVDRRYDSWPPPFPAPVARPRTRRPPPSPGAASGPRPMLGG